MCRGLKEKSFLIIIFNCLFQTLSPSRRIPAGPVDGATATSASGSVVDMLDVSLNDGDEERKAASAAGATSDEKRRRRVQRRVIHCSDGVVEEYSTDEEELEELRSAPITCNCRPKLSHFCIYSRRKKEDERKKTSLIDPRTLTWLPWMIHYTWNFGSSFVG